MTRCSSPSRRRRRCGQRWRRYGRSWSGALPAESGLLLLGSYRQFLVDEQLPVALITLPYVHIAAEWRLVIVVFGGVDQPKYIAKISRGRHASARRHPLPAAGLDGHGLHDRRQTGDGLMPFLQ